MRVTNLLSPNKEKYLEPLQLSENYINVFNMNVFSLLVVILGDFNASITPASVIKHTLVKCGTKSWQKQWRQKVEQEKFLNEFVLQV